jgi:hypothetical protein
MSMKTMSFVAVVAALAGTPALAANILVNPGFETGSLAPWFQGNDFGGPENWNVTNKEAHTGTFSATDVGNKQLRQDFAPVLVSDILEASLWIKNPDDGGPRINAVDFYYSDGTHQEHLLFQPDNNWNFNDVTGFLTPGKSLTAFAFYGYIGGGPNEDRTYVDDFVLNVVPTPSAAVLLGLGALSAARRRR